MGKGLRTSRGKGDIQDVSTLPAGKTMRGTGEGRGEGREEGRMVRERGGKRGIGEGAESEKRGSWRTASILR